MIGTTNLAQQMAIAQQMSSPLSNPLGYVASIFGGSPLGAGFPISLDPLAALNVSPWFNMNVPTGNPVVEQLRQLSVTGGLGAAGIPNAPGAALGGAGLGGLAAGGGAAAGLGLGGALGGDLGALLGGGTGGGLGALLGGGGGLAGLLGGAGLGALGGGGGVPAALNIAVPRSEKELTDFRKQLPKTAEISRTGELSLSLAAFKKIEGLVKAKDFDGVQKVIRDEIVSIAGTNASPARLLEAITGRRVTGDAAKNVKKGDVQKLLTDVGKSLSNRVLSALNAGIRLT